jgi:hypothetical protein
MIELTLIALRFRTDCLKFAKRTDLGEDLRQRFRRDADYWGQIADGMLSAAVGPPTGCRRPSTLVWESTPPTFCPPAAQLAAPQVIN